MPSAVGLRIALDFDGTVARTMDLVCHLMNYRLGSNFTAKDVTSWEWPVETAEREAAFWDAYDLMDRSNLRLSLEPFDEDTIQTVSELSSQYGHHVDIITSNELVARRTILDWLSIQCDRFQVEPLAGVADVICVGRGSAADKVRLDYDVFIDDRPSMQPEILAAPGKAGLLPNTRWNTDVPDHPRFRRFRWWKEVPALIRSLQEELKCQSDSAA